MNVSIPKDIVFSALELRYGNNGQVKFNEQALRSFLLENNQELATDTPLDFETVSVLILMWYLKHKALGGEKDRTMEFMFDLVDAQNEENPH